MDKDMIEAVMGVAMENPWISGKASILDGDPFEAFEYELTENSFAEIEDPEELAEKLSQGCWARNAAFIYKDFAFINQTNGGSEWAVFKYDPETKTAFQFESITGDWMGKEKILEFLKRIERATNEQLKKLEY